MHTWLKLEVLSQKNICDYNDESLILLFYWLACPTSFFKMRHTCQLTWNFKFVFFLKKNFVLPESTACLQNHHVWFIILLVSNTILFPTLTHPCKKKKKKVFNTFQHFRSCQCKHFLPMYNIHFNLNLCAIYEFPLKTLKTPWHNSWEIFSSI